MSAVHPIAAIGEIELKGSSSAGTDGGVRRQLRQLCIGYRSLARKSSGTAAFQNGEFTLSTHNGLMTNSLAMAAF
jgi:hypothetical protein